MLTGSRNIRDLSLEDIIHFFSEKGEKSFRAKQVYEWLWQNPVHSFDEMSNLSKSLRNLLNDEFVIHNLEINNIQVSKDKTIKSSFLLHDGVRIEGVLIPSSDRMTACVSTQAGCSLSCSFCATGRLKRIRNLNADEIYDQVVMLRNQASEHYKMALTNIVYMGMGEPLLNYDNVMRSVEMITSSYGLNMSPQRITVSTAGITKMIKKLADEQARFHLALSLHAANDYKRSKIMPVNKRNSLDSLAEALNYFYTKTNRRITLEYILLKNFNDSLEDAKELVAFCSRFPSKVNIIEYNPVEKSTFRSTDKIRTDAFKNYLETKKIIVNVRGSRGKDIDAACGQLANRKVSGKG